MGELSRRGGKHTRPRSRLRIVLVGLGAVLAVYYTLAWTSINTHDPAVHLDGRPEHLPADRVTLQLEAVNVDTGTGSFDLRIRPVPRGTLATPDGSRPSESLHVAVSSAGTPPTGFDFSADQIADPVAASVEIDADVLGFPFDRPSVHLHLEASGDDGPLPVDVEMADEAEGWNLVGALRPTDSGVELDLQARREMLSISFALFYITGTVVVTLIAIAVIGGAVNRRRIDFERVIWLGAMLVVIPAVRNEMPGVPPVGTAVDLFVFLPSIVVVALALMAAIAVLVIDETASDVVPAEGDRR